MTNQLEALTVELDTAWNAYQSELANYFAGKYSPGAVRCQMERNIERIREAIAELSNAPAK